MLNQTPHEPKRTPIRNSNRNLVDVRQVKANVLKSTDNPQGTVVVQAKTASADAIIQVMDGARDAGVFDISLAADKLKNVRIRFLSFVFKEHLKNLYLVSCYHDREQ